MSLPPEPEVTVIVPLPLVGEEETEYVALNAAPDIGPLGEPTSAVPVILPLGLPPFAMNSPENTTTSNVAGVVVEPAKASFTSLLVNDLACWDSPNPNKTLSSVPMRNA